MTFNDRFDLFFHDYNMSPLFVQENYLHSKPKCSSAELLKRVAMAADSLSIGDMIEKKIRSSQSWSLLPTQAAFSSVLPGYYMEGAYTSAVKFPGWLGKQSRSNKRKRLAQEVHDHTRMLTSGSRLSVRLDYASFLVNAIVRPLKEKGVEGVQDALAVIKEYHLLREDIDGLIELTTWPKMKNPWDSVESKVKAALTRAYNKEVQPYTYSVQAGVKKKSGKSTAADEGVEGYEDQNEDGGPPSENEEEDDSLENNAFVKVKKSTAASSKASSSKAGTSSKQSTSLKPSTSKATKSKAKK
jgi:replication factor C subunit 1